MIISFSFIKVSAQIYNLKDYLMYAKMPLDNFALTLENDINWKEFPPSQNRIDDIRVREIYSFGCKLENNKSQILKRSILGNLYSGNRVESTILICNDYILLNEIKIDLLKDGFFLKIIDKFKVRFCYQKNKSLIQIQTKSLNDSLLPEGCYSISMSQL